MTEIDHEAALEALRLIVAYYGDDPDPDGQCVLDNARGLLQKPEDK